MTDTETQAGPGRLAINRLQSAGPLDADDVDRFLDGRDVPLVEGLWCTFLWRGEADEAWI
jgi:enterochelin esterase family protein